MLEDIDRQISNWTESFVRTFNRRKMVGTTVKGLFATVAAATVGQLADIGQAFAATCTCDSGWTQGHPCDYWGYPCPSNGCPSGLSTCYKGGCGGWCEYSGGHWVSCTGLKCSNGSYKGYKLCWDCYNATAGHLCKPKCSCLTKGILGC